MIIKNFFISPGPRLMIQIACHFLSTWSKEPRSSSPSLGWSVIQAPLSPVLQCQCLASNADSVWMIRGWFSWFDFVVPQWVRLFYLQPNLIWVQVYCCHGLVITVVRTLFDNQSSRILLGIRRTWSVAWTWRIVRETFQVNFMRKVSFSLWLYAVWGPIDHLW